MSVLPLLSSLWQSTYFHLALSVALHAIGICMGLWIWYIFPKNPDKNVTRMAVRVRTSELMRNSQQQDRREEVAELLVEPEGPQEDLETRLGGMWRPSNRRFG